MNTAERLDSVIDDLEARQPDLARFYEVLGNDFPVMVSFLTDTDTELLTDEEQAYVLYLAMVLIHLFQQQSLLNSDLDQEALGSAEEFYWQMINASSPRPLEKIWDQTPVDAVLSQFILESLAMDEEAEFLTEAGSQIAFVKLAALANAIQSG